MRRALLCGLARKKYRFSIGATKNAGRLFYSNTYLLCRMACTSNGGPDLWESTYRETNAKSKQLNVSASNQTQPALLRIFRNRNIEFLVTWSFPQSAKPRCSSFCKTAVA